MRGYKFAFNADVGRLYGMIEMKIEAGGGGKRVHFARSAAISRGSVLSEL